MGEQLALLPELEILPARPTPGTLVARLLAMLASGEELVHTAFFERTGSWRLAAVAFELRALGWAVDATRIPAPAPENPERSIASYSLLARHRALVSQEAR